MKWITNIGNVMEKTQSNVLGTQVREASQYSGR